MNSSISNSDQEAHAPTIQRGALWKIAALLVGVFVLLEIFTRGYLIPHSKDFVRFEGYPARAEHLVRQPGVRLAFIGNSVTECGVDPQLLAEKLPAIARKPVPMDFFLADGAAINTWYYMVKHDFWKEERRPDWIIVHYFGDLLADGNAFDIGRIALFFTDASDWQDLVDLDLPTSADRADYVLSRHWATLAVRDRFRSRALVEIVPHYKEFAEDLNVRRLQEQRQAAARHEGRSMSPAPKTYKALERFLVQAVRHQCKVCFVAFPTRPSDGQDIYVLDPAALASIHQAGMQFLDLRHVPELKDEHYRDGVHLTPAGAKIYTERFVQAFRPLLNHD